MKITLLSWNIWIKGNFKEITDYIKKQNADIIGLQEVKDNDPDLDIKSFLKSLGYEHVYAPIEQEWLGVVYRHGPAIFSKYPIRQSQEFNLHASDNRKLLRADIDINGEIYHVFNTHLLHTHQKESEVQLEQVKNLMTKISGEKNILMGDFNAVPSSSTISEVASVFKDTDKDSRPTWCVFKDGCDVCLHEAIDIRLDYIFVSSDLETDNFSVGESKGSDHLPIQVRVEV
jgi:endonuclease/exonuclease/phosphatase family metal-dependent hydrolase